MAKASGSTRALKTIPVSTKTLNQISNTFVSSGMYDAGESFTNEQSGAFYLQAKGREPDGNERLAALSLVRKGISVIITPEGDIRYATAFKPDGTPKFSDGIAAVYTYEQKTIEKDATQITNNFIRGIQHAVDKKAEIALIFDRYGKAHRHQVEQAMKEFKLPSWGTMPKMVVVMDKNGDYYEHYF